MTPRLAEAFLTLAAVALLVAVVLILLSPAILGLAATARRVLHP